MLELWFESVCAVLFLLILLNALPVPMLRQVYFLCFFRYLLLGCFWKGLFIFFRGFCEVLDVPREVIFCTFLEKIEVFGEKVGLSFFAHHYSVLG